jgi:type VI secretion system secreted protein VgrG
MPGAVIFAPQRTTPWPEVPSLLTALVTGPSGDEIHTEDYGRIRVQFPWDRDGKKDDKSSCWVRTVMPWAGKDYGFIAVPRIGMEVIIQFERGNIDRPICTGMVYNGINKPPYGLPGEMDTIALRTNSTKGGGGYHELSFKDKKDAEKIFFQSEKDYEQKIKNNAVITIGMEKKDKGDLTQTVYRHMTETIKTGDVTQTIETGSRITTIKTDDTTKVQTGNMTTTVETGNLSETVSKGNMSTTVSKGNQSTEVSLGNISIKASAGAITVEAAQSITLKVGGNSITIDTTGIKVDGAIVAVKAEAQASVEGALVKVSASGITTVQGAMVKIN